MAKKYNKQYKSNNRYKYSNKHSKNDTRRYSGNKNAYEGDKWNYKNYNRTGNYYINKDGEYKEKPWYANFFKVGFSDDVPTKADYYREMDGIVDYKETDPYEMENLYGLERFQLSMHRLWNGSPREWAKLITRVLILLLLIGIVALVVKFFNLPTLFETILKDLNLT